MSAEIERALGAFVAGGPRRSVLLEALAGPLAPTALACGADEVYPAASLLKLVVALAVHRASAAGELDLHEEVAVHELPRSDADASVLAAFDAGRSLSLGELVRLSLVTSDNAAADHLVRRVGLAALGAELARLGSSSTRFERGFAPGELGLLGDANPTCARDVAGWLRTLWIADAPGAREIVGALGNNLRNTRLTARFARPVPHKTGSLPGVVHDAALVAGREHVVVLVALSEQELDEEAAARAQADLAAAVWTALGEPL